MLAMSTAYRVFAVVLIAIAVASTAYWIWAVVAAAPAPQPSPAEATGASQLATGRDVYARYCAICHGAQLEGQPNWQQRLSNGRLPAPPHDDSGHTWHHPDDVLFEIVKYGLVPGKLAPPGYESDMPAFQDHLSDADIRAVLGYIASHWSPKVLESRSAMNRRIREAQRVRQGSP